MSHIDVEALLDGYVRGIERLHLDPVRLQAAIAKAATRPRRGSHRRRGTPLAVGFACLLLSAGAAAAATGWLGSALDHFFDGGSVPGRELSGRDLPEWLRPSPGFIAPSEVSEVAAAGDERLYAYRQGGHICFDYGHHVGECRSPGEWRQELERKPWIVRPTARNSVWFGLIDEDVASVEVEYRQGATEDVAVSNGGFVALLDRSRDPERLVGRDSTGNEVVSEPLAAEGP
jgi:hypothetical protein